MKIKTRLFTTAVISVILLVGTFTYTSGSTPLVSIDSQKEDAAINYLTNVMFVPSVGLDKKSFPFKTYAILPRLTISVASAIVSLTMQRNFSVISFLPGSRSLKISSTVFVLRFTITRCLG